MTAASAPLTTTRAASLRRWAAAAAVVFTMHVSVVAWALHQAATEVPDDDVSGSAVPIEMAVAAAAEPADIASKIGPPTPQIAEQAATDARDDTRQAPEEKIEPIPDLTPAEAPDAILQQPPAEPKEVEDERPDAPPKPATVAVAAQEAAAPPSVPAPAADRTISISPGITPSQRKSKASWQKALLTHIDQSKRYPDGARAAHAEGETVVEFTIDRTGAVLTKRLVRASGSSLLDAEALALLARAEPLPQPPSDIAGETFTLAVPVRFRLR